MSRRKLPFPSKRKIGAREIKKSKGNFLLGSALTRGRRDSLVGKKFPPLEPLHFLPARSKLVGGQVFNDLVTGLLLL